MLLLEKKRGDTKMKYSGDFSVFEDIINEIMMVYEHDNRPWLIGFSGGKDSTLLTSLVYEALLRLKQLGAPLNKKIYIVTSDTLLENPIIKTYMHETSKNINKAAKRDRLPIQADIIYPDANQTFWSKIIGLGYVTPEPPGFRWCTDRLKIKPMNKFVYERIQESKEVIILLGIRKAESTSRKHSIESREIDGKILTPHNDIENAYTYSPIANVSNELVWPFLLKDEGKSPWGADLYYLYSLYQGETVNEEQSVLGQVDKDNLPSAGSSRFGCWCCTIVREDKSMQRFIDSGVTELIPLKDFRSWLLSIRNNPDYREKKKRNGSVYRKADGSFGLGPFTLDARNMILEKLLELENETGFALITIDELREIDRMWDLEGDLSRRRLVDTYSKIKGEKLPWDEYKVPLFDEETIGLIDTMADKHDIPAELIKTLIITVN